MNRVVRLVRRHPVTTFVVLAYAVAWAFWPAGSFGAFGPLVAALVVVPTTSGRQGLRRLAARVVRWRVGWVWWVAAFAVPIGVHSATEALTLLGGGTPDGLTRTSLTTALMAFLVRLVNPTDGPLAEEPSWRGYAQPALQDRGHSPLVSTTVLAVLIAAWHLPLFFMVEGGPTVDVVVPELLTTMAVTYWYAWLFNRTGGSALLPLVAHCTEGVFSAEGWTYTAVWCAVALVVLVGDRRCWASRASDRSRVHGSRDLSWSR